MKSFFLSLFCPLLLCGASLNNFELAKAVHQVESSGRLDLKIIGDNGKAIGPLQIHFLNWKDATLFDKTIGGSYFDCHKLDYSKRIFDAYLRKYAKNQSAEVRARTWNGGPSGAKKQSTNSYWNKIKKNLR